MIHRFLADLFEWHRAARRCAAAVERVLHGLPVRILNTRPDIETERVVQRLTAALDLIAAYAPKRYRRLRQDIGGPGWSNASPAGALSSRRRASAWWS